MQQLITIIGTMALGAIIGTMLLIIAVTAYASIWSAYKYTLCRITARRWYRRAANKAATARLLETVIHLTTYCGYGGQTTLSDVETALYNQLLQEEKTKTKKH